MLIEYFDSLGNLNGKEIGVPALRALSLLLISLGADEIIIPAPGERATEHVRKAIETLPEKRRGNVRLVDSNRATMKRVMKYLLPLKQQAVEWPETTFVDLALNSLYFLTLAFENKASVIDGGIPAIHDFLSIIRPNSYKDEAKFTLAELFRLFTLFEPNLLDRIEFNMQVPYPEVQRVLPNLISSAEFAEFVSSNARLGFLRHPAMGLRRVKTTLRNVVSSKGFRKVVRGGLTVSQLAPLPVNVSGLRDILPVATKGTEFSPPFIELPLSVHLSICQAALREFDPRAVAVPGNLYAQSSLMGSIRWLADKPEDRLKLQDNPQELLLRQKTELSSAKKNLVNIMN